MSVLLEVLLEIVDLLFVWGNPPSKRSRKRRLARFVALVFGLLALAAGGIAAVLWSPVVGLALALCGLAGFLLFLLVL